MYVIPKMIKEVVIKIIIMLIKQVHSRADDNDNDNAVNSFSLST